MKDKPKKPEQHEDILAGVARIEALLRYPPQPVKIEVRCSCCAETQREILGVVKDIQRRIGGLSEAEEAGLARRLKEAKDSLSGAVEANQP